MQTVQKTVEIPQVQFLDKVVDIPVVVQRQVPMVQKVQKTLEVPQLQIIDKVVDIPVVAQREIPMKQFQSDAKGSEEASLQIYASVFLQIAERRLSRGTSGIEASGKQACTLCCLQRCPWIVAPHHDGITAP